MTNLYQKAGYALLAGFLFLSGCGKEKDSQDYQPTPTPLVSQEILPEQPEPEENPNSELENHLVNFTNSEADGIAGFLSSNPKRAKELLVEKWKNYYRGKGEADIEKSIKNSGQIISQIKYIFEEEGVPTEYAFLAIPESNWSLTAKSGASAVGPYQFICSTANQSGLRCNKSLDERVNPFLSARGAARLLKDLNSRFGGDWDLTLAAYNSGMPWQYLKTDRDSPTYDEYVNFTGKNLATISEKVSKESTSISQKVKKGETRGKFIRRVAGKGLTDKQILKIARDNKIPSQLRAGQKYPIDISEINPNYKDRLMNTRTRFIEENLNYPAKFIAVIDVLKSDYKEYFESAPQRGVNFYKLPKNKTLAEVSREKKVGIKTLLELNPHLKGKVKKIKKKTIRTADITNLPKGATIVLPGN